MPDQKVDPETVARICETIANQTDEDLKKIPESELAVITRAVRDLKRAVDQAAERLAHVDLTLLN